jgi:SAM-dependent methyltransferase
VNTPATKDAVAVPVRAGFACRVCGSTGPFTGYRVREMMFGSGEFFDYALCDGCGCLQIIDIPQDLGRHYGEGYYSYGAGGARRADSAVRRARNRHLAGRVSPLGWLAARFRHHAALASLRPLRLPLNARILDVGCGGGELLLDLQSAGFTRLLGADPFVAQDLDLGGGLRVLRRELQAVEGEFDLVMFHHALEHVPDPQAALHAAFERLAPQGRCIVRIPTVSSWAWRHYGVHWCALDAPRHLILHSRKSIKLLAHASGFVVDSIGDDANSFQFWGSEQYSRGIALMRPGNRNIEPAPGVFTDAQLHDFERRARELNRQSDGDQIVVYLRRPS